jgi:LmbE family N-acetylglucosaminyl deacetylase
MAIGRYHPDHLAAGVATLAAIYPACQNPWDFPELLDEGLPPHKVREVYIMGAPEQNYASDISATFDLKLAALAAHTSQVGSRMAELEPRLRQWASELGAQHGFQYAEVFHKTENG